MMNVFLSFGMKLPLYRNLHAYTIDIDTLRKKYYTGPSNKI